MRPSLLCLSWLAACHREPSPGPTPEPSDTDVPPVTDSGTTGTDSTPIDTGEPEPEPEWLFEPGDVLVVPHTDGVMFVQADGGIAAAPSWPDLVGPCDDCIGEGASADGDGLLVSFDRTADENPGGIARLGPGLVPDFRLDGLGFPHDVVRDPVDGTLVVAETSEERIVWLAGDGTSATPVRTFDAATDGWFGGRPNGLERFDHDGRSLLLVSHRGGAGNPPQTGLGEITLWDVSVAGSPSLLWRFPGLDGELDQPHGAIVRRYGGQWWLLYAHGRGAGNQSTVGLAVADDLLAKPTYVADLVVEPPLAPLVYLRGVELTTDGRLWLTDSGGQQGGSTGAYDGRILVADLPFLAPRGGSGSVTFEQQVFEPLPAELLVDGIDNPFEGWLWKNPSL